MNVPTLRFKDDAGQDFPEWKESKLQDIAQINPKSDSLPNEFIYIDLESVEKGNLLKEIKVSKSEAPSRAQRLIQKNDVLFQMVRPYQGNNLFFDKSGDYVASTGYAQIKTLENPRFLYQYLHLESFTAEVINRCTGTSYPAINSSGLATIKVVFPSIIEQTKIANFLTAVDEKITQLTQKFVLLVQYKKGVMQQIFSQELRFKHDDGQDFPDWMDTTLGEVAEIKRGAASQHLKYVEDKLNGIRLIRINDFLKNEPVYVEETQDIKRFTLQRNDLLIAGTGATAGIVFRVPDEFENLAYSYNAPRIRVNQANDGFIYYYLISDIVLKQQQGLFVGNAQPFLDTDAIRGFQISLPSFPEQIKIANFLTAIDDKITATQAQLDAVRQYKQGLLQQMFV